MSTQFELREIEERTATKNTSHDNQPGLRGKAGYGDTKPGTCCITRIFCDAGRVAHLSRHLWVSVAVADADEVDVVEVEVDEDEDGIINGSNGGSMTRI